jgi:signal transduction histidine kinase
MSQPEHKRCAPRLPWTVVIAGWVVYCCLVAGLLYGWHANERRACEREATGLARTLSATLRTMSRRVTESTAVLLEVLEETVGAATLSGIALTDATGRPAAVVGIEPAMLARTDLAPEGVLFLPEQVLVWRSLTASACDPGGTTERPGWGRRHSRLSPVGAAIGDERIRPVRLVLSMPHDVCQAQWLYARLLAVALVCVGLLVALGLGQLWSMGRRNAAYAVRLRLAEQEKQALEELNLVAAGLAHEIKNPLGVIRGTAQRLCGTGIDGSEAAAAPATIVDEIDRVTSRIDELLSFARPREPVLHAVSLMALCREIESLMAGDFADEHLELQLPPDDLCVQADREQLRLVLFNLLHNVVRFAAGSGAVGVEWHRTTAGTCILRVRDHGPGVAESVRSKVFAPYVTTCASGTGLGLAIVRRIVMGHGWQVACLDAPGGGALFEITGIHVGDETVAAGGHQ